MKTIIQKIADGQNLTADEAQDVMSQIMSGKATDAQIGAFLTALRIKGETTEEIAAMATIMRKFATNIRPDVGDKYLVDTCGTGGDKIKTFNISTTAMFVVAGAGIPIAKHGNRAVSSKSGSADILENLCGSCLLGMTPDDVKKSIEDIGIGFMFAPLFHSAMKHVMPARTQIGIRTVFNILGPLTNPANASGQIVGVYDSHLTEKIAGVLRIMGLKRGMVVSGIGGIDEISLIGATKISQFTEDKKMNTYYIEPEEIGFEKCKKEMIAGGDVEYNAKILRDILSKGEIGPRRDIVVANAAGGIVVGGLAGNIKEAVAIAEKSIDSGAALQKLEDFTGFCRMNFK